MSGTDRPHELGAFLAGIPFFASFDEGTLVWLARQFEPIHAQAGNAVIAEGDPGDGLYVLLSGRLRVSVGERVLHDLGRGAVIGEIAPLSDRMRSATVRAVRDSDLFLLRTASFKALIEQNPGFLGGGTVIAVDISLLLSSRSWSPRSGRGLSGWKALADRLNPLRPPQPVPSVLDIVEQAGHRAVGHAAPAGDAGRRARGPAAAPAGPGDRRVRLQGRRRADRDRLPARCRGAGGLRYPRSFPLRFRCGVLLSGTGPLLRRVPQ